MHGRRYGLQLGAVLAAMAWAPVLLVWIVWALWQLAFASDPRNMSAVQRALLLLAQLEHLAKRKQGRGEGEGE